MNKIIRIIPRLDIKPPNLIKSIQMEGLRVIGNPEEHAVSYYQQGADEMICIDVVASLYMRNNLRDFISSTVREVFIPVTVGGGVRSLQDAKNILRAGADRIALNTAAIECPGIINDLAESFGASTVVLSIQAKETENGRWVAMTDNGRERSERDVIEWAKEGAQRGCGEILLTSVDREGTRRGYDVELLKAVTTLVDVPVIASGGFGCVDHILEVVREGGADAVAIADAFHYRRTNVYKLKHDIRQAGLFIR